MVFRWPLPLAAVWVTIPIVGLMLRLAFEPTAPYDYWWSLVMGRLIAGGAGIPETNLFLYTLAADTPFHNQPWLAQWLMFEIYEWASHGGLAIARTVIAGLTWAGLITLAIRRGADPRWVGGLAMALVVVGGQVFGVRTQIFAFLPYLALLWVLVEIAEGRLGRGFLFGLLPVVAFWANVHGTFIFAPVFVGAMGASLVLEGLRKRQGFAPREALFWLGATLAFVCAGALNPEGFRIYAYVLALSTNPEVAQGVTEWQAPSFATVEGTFIIAAFIATSAFGVYRWRVVKVWEAVFFIGTAYLAMSSMRSVFWWTAVAFIVIAPLITRGRQTVPEGGVTTGQGLGHGVAIGVLVGLCIALQPGFDLHAQTASEMELEFRQDGEGAFVLSYRNPVELVRDLGKRGYRGNLFHYQGIGGLIEFELTTLKSPAQVAFVDQRIELIPSSVWNDYFAIQAPGGEEWARIVESHGIGAFLVLIEEQGKLVEHLEAHERWIPVAMDEAFVLFVDGEDEDFLTRWPRGPIEIEIAP